MVHVCYDPGEFRQHDVTAPDLSTRPLYRGEIVGPIFTPISHVDYGNHLARVHHPGVFKVQAATGDSRGSSKPHR